jgi:exportin-2 (importin alpha re-exporter)
VLIARQQLVNHLSPTEYGINCAVLETAHSIFAPWRAQVRTDALFTVINHVLARFVDPVLVLLRATAQLLLAPGGGAHGDAARAFAVLVAIYYDLSCQDLPPALEDAHLEFWAADGGIFLQFLAWDPPELRGDVRRAVPPAHRPAHRTHSQMTRPRRFRRESRPASSRRPRCARSHSVRRRGS